MTALYDAFDAWQFEQALERAATRAREERVTIYVVKVEGGYATTREPESLISPREIVGYVDPPRREA